MLFRSDLVVVRRRRDGRPAVCPQRQGCRGSSIIMPVFILNTRFLCVVCVVTPTPATAAGERRKGQMVGVSKNFDF
jgi:hypothetical protein